MITSEDIAKHLGISRGTVSRALNNHGRISEETRQRVLAAASQLGYEPNRAARALVGAKPVKSAISIFSEPVSFWGVVKEGIHYAQDELKHFGFHAEVVEHPIDAPQEQMEQLWRLYKQGVRAIAIAPNDPVFLSGTVRKLSQLGVSFISFNVDIAADSRLCYLGCDYTKAGRLAGYVLARLLPPEATVAALCFSPEVLAVSQRMQGFRAVMTEYPGIRVVTEDGYKRNGDRAYEKTLSLLRARPDIDGIFVSFGILEDVARALITQGLDKKIRLVGYDLSGAVEGYIRDGVIDATVCHDPLMQGYYSAKMLYNLAALGQKPLTDEIHTKLEIVMRENLDSHTDEINRISALKTIPK